MTSSGTAILFLFIATGTLTIATIEEEPDTSAGDFEKLIQKAVENIRQHTNVLAKNATAVFKEFQIDETVEGVGGKNAPTVKKTIDLIESFLKTVKEQIRPITQGLDDEAGVQTTLNKLWDLLKSKFAYLTNLLTDTPSARKAFTNAKDTFGKIREFFSKAFNGFTNFLYTAYGKVTGRGKDLQALGLNSSLETIIEAGKKMYDESNTMTDFKKLSESMQAFWKQISTEVAEIKKVLSDKEALAKKFEELKENFANGPEALKDLLANYQTGKNEDDDLINLLAMAVGRKVNELKKNPAPLEEMLKKIN